MDALLKELEAVLKQEDENENLRPIVYINRSLTLVEKNYYITDLKCLAIIWSIQHFHKYLINKSFKILAHWKVYRKLQNLLKKKPNK